MGFRTAYQLVRSTIQEFQADQAPRLGAALAFYAVLSLSPLLLVIMAIAGFVFGAEAARGEIFEQVREWTGDEVAKAVETMLANTQTKRGGWLATTVGLLILLYGASSIFAQLQDALNTMWGKKPQVTSTGVWSILRDRLLSLLLVCGLGLLLLISLILSVILNVVDSYACAWLPYGRVWLGIGNQLISFGLTILLFAMIYTILPDQRPTWSEVWIGAILTACLFSLGKYLIGLYLGKAAVGSEYGAAGSLVVLLVWIYYSTQIVLFGAEFTQVYARWRNEPDAEKQI